MTTCNADEVACRPNGCDGYPFDRVVISRLMPGGARVYWALRDDFLDLRPFSFQLQVGSSRDNEADAEWSDVGSPVVDVFTAVDGERRAESLFTPAYYRVVLTTAEGTYRSLPTGAEGTLSGYDWRLARQVVRQALVKMRKGPGGQVGYLLKRRVTGENCPVCLDPQTNDVRRPDCPYCFGTGKLCGYYFPFGCTYAVLDPKAYRVKVDLQARGAVGDIVVKARMINTVMLGEDDVFVNRVTDDRYYVHEVQNTQEWRGVPLVANVLMRPATPTDPIYMIDIPGQLLDVEELAGRV